MIHALPVPSIDPPRRSPRTLTWLLGALFTLAALVGCGGGGGSTAGLPITIQVAPTDQTVADGESATLAVAATSVTPLSYQWLRNGESIDGATNALYVTPALTLADSGTRYAVVVRNVSASVQTAPATVTVTAAPRIARQPQSQTVAPGQAPTFAVQAFGTAPLTYEWRRDGVVIPGASASSYTAAAAIVSDNGATFQVIVRNASGKATSDPAVLSVLGAGPVVVGVPGAFVAAPGQSLRISFTVAGTPPFNYQWWRDGQAISGAAGTTNDPTLSLSTGPLAAADDGVRFHLTISTAEGSARSTDAVISVIAAPRVAAGGAHSLARSADGRLWAWGDNSYGQLGLGPTPSQSTPTLVAALAGVRSIVAGTDHSLALKDDGTVWAWGRNATGALGDGTQTDRSVPQQVAGLADVVAIAAAAGRSFALRADGSLWGWGENSTGALGIGTQNNVLVPTQVAGIVDAIAVAAGARHTLALRGDGQVSIMGEIAVPIAGPPSVLTSPTVVAGLGEVAGIAAGDGFSLALDVNGRLWSWGVNDIGQLGLGSTTPQAVPTEIDLPQPALRLTAGQAFGLLRALDGSAFAWGAGASGQLGTGDTPASIAAPGLIGSLLPPTSDIVAGREHALAVRSDGSVYAWGANASGQLGIGSVELQRNEPVQVPGLNLN